MGKVLVTGGAGFIGSHFCNMLAKNNFSVICYDKLSYASDLSYLHTLLPQLFFVQADINDLDTLRKTCSQNDVEYIVNFAAESHVDRSIDDCKPFLDSNINGVANILTVARELTDIKKVVQISTDEVYGSLGYEAPASFERDKLEPMNPYSATKTAAEHLCKSFHNTYGVPVVITRSSNNFGPHQHEEKLLPKALSSLFAYFIGDTPFSKIPVYGKGENVRDWLFVKDNCEGIYEVMLGGKPGEAYNIGGTNEYKNIDFLKIVFEEVQKLGKTRIKTFEEAIEFVPDRLGHDIRYSISSQKIKNNLDWKPRSDFKKALVETIKWYSEKWKK